MAFPALAQPLSPPDEAAYRAAFGAAKARDWVAAGQVASQATERLPAKVLSWLQLLRGTDPAFAEIASFADQNPGWPLIGTLRQRAEGLTDALPDATVEPYFRAHWPATLKGKLRFAGILTATGSRDAADSLIRDLWVGTDLAPEDEALILDRFASNLRPEDHIARLDRLLWSGQTVAARRQLARVPEDWRRIGEARLALQGQRADAETTLALVPEQRRADAGLIFDHLRWLRRAGRTGDAETALRAPPQPLTHASAWWGERDTLAQRFLDEGQDEKAYGLYGWRGLGETGNELADAEFAAGWVALARLKDPARAFEHFQRLYAGVRTPISLARGAYWAGRASEAQGQAAEARQWFAKAAEQRLTYYGQLAATRLGEPPTPVIRPDPQPTPADAQRFEQRELVRAARMLAQIGETDLAKPFVAVLQAGANTLPDLELVAALATSVGHKDVALTAARRAGTQGALLLDEAYPTVPLDAKGLAERPLVLAMIRQESAFDPTAISRSDARGLMQLKPSTAKDVATSLTLPFSPDRLTLDPPYNVVLGRAYLEKLLDGFGGSYVLAVAAYNAGPGRVRQWIATYGDPRSGTIDPVDWVETLPFKETRNYVQRVLENLQLYRLRLDDQQNAFKIADDLKR